MSEAAEFTVDASIAPGRVLAIETEYEESEFGGGGWPSGSGCRWLGPVAGDEAAVPADHGCGFDDQHHAVEPATLEGTRQDGQDRAVGRREPRALDLALEHEDLMAKGQDLGVSLVTAY